MKIYFQISDRLLCSVVIYVGKGAGKNDDGEYTIDNPRELLPKVIKRIQEQVLDADVDR